MRNLALSMAAVLTLGLAAACKTTDQTAQPSTTVTTTAASPATSATDTKPRGSSTATETKSTAKARLSQPAETLKPSSRTFSAKPGPRKKPGEAASPSTTDRADTAPQQPRGKKYPVCKLGDLPPEAGRVAALIRAGGPFKFRGKDGSTFGNRERRLPQERRGYYREYTVLTPGVKHRGARRIVTGGNPETNPPFWYYTKDHYESFCLIGGA